MDKITYIPLALIVTVYCCSGLQTVSHVFCQKCWCYRDTITCTSALPDIFAALNTYERKMNLDLSDLSPNYYQMLEARLPYMIRRFSHIKLPYIFVTPTQPYFGTTRTAKKPASTKITTSTSTYDMSEKTPVFMPASENLQTKPVLFEPATTATVKDLKKTLVNKQSDHFTTAAATHSLSRDPLLISSLQPVTGTDPQLISSSSQRSAETPLYTSIETRLTEHHIEDNELYDLSILQNMREAANGFQLIHLVYTAVLSVIITSFCITAVYVGYTKCYRTWTPPPAPPPTRAPTPAPRTRPPPAEPANASNAPTPKPRQSASAVSARQPAAVAGDHQPATAASAHHAPAANTPPRQAAAAAAADAYSTRQISHRPIRAPPLPPACHEVIEMTYM